MDPTQNPHGNTPDETLADKSRLPAVPAKGFVPQEQKPGLPMGTPNLNTTNEPAPPENRGPALVPPRPEVQEPAKSSSRLSLWMHRTSLVISVIFCIELGMLLAILPWTRVWTDNGLLVGYPLLKSFFQNSFVRGLATGIGLVDIWLGVSEAVHYRESGDSVG